MVTDEERLSLSDGETFQDPDRVHDIFRRLRTEEPVAWCPEPWGGPGFWSITTYDDIHEISKNPRVFSSDDRHGGIKLESPEMVRNRRPRSEVEESGAELLIFQGGRSMITMDPPEQTRNRRIIAPGFTPQKLDAMIPQIRARCTDILNRIAAQKECEFVSAVAAELPIQMLAELFGMPPEDRYKLSEWSNIVVGGEDLEVTTSSDYVSKGFMEMAQYAMQLHQARLTEPGEDLISMLAHSMVDGKPMDAADYLSVWALLVVAGNETTRNSISGGIQALSQHPEERQKLLDDPSMIPRAVDEIIRWVHPVVYMRRTALEDTRLGDRQIKAGDKLALWYMSGNRDERKWDDPYRFDATRNGPRHLSFGYGQHLCIGWRLAEIQLTVALEEILRRFPNFQVVGPVDRMNTNFINSIKRMTVRWTRE